MAEIRLSLPDEHHFLVDLDKCGLDNPNHIVHTADRPDGLIETSVLRDGRPARRVCVWEGTAAFS